MQKFDNYSTTYPLNERTKLRVVNKPDSDAFKTTVSLTHKLVMFRPLEFSNPNEIADFFGGLDYEEEQQSLLPSESPTERFIKLQVRHDILEILKRVENGGTKADEAIEVIDGLVTDLIGKDDDDAYPFPAGWDTNQRKNWVHSRNHIRRQMRAEYKG